MACASKVCIFQVGLSKISTPKASIAEISVVSRREIKKSVIKSRPRKISRRQLDADQVRLVEIDIRIIQAIQQRQRQIGICEVNWITTIVRPRFASPDYLKREDYIG